MIGAMSPAITRCGVCDVVTVTPAICAECHEPICLKHTRIRGAVGAREYVCATCVLDAVTTEG